MRRLGMLHVVVGVLILQGCTAPHEPAPVERVYRGKTFLDYERASLNQETYRVQAGETLYSIAFRANMDLREIAQLNGLSHPYTIFVGQELRLRPSTPVPSPRSSPTQETVATRSSSEYGVTNNQQSTQTTSEQSAGPSTPRSESSGTPATPVVSSPSVQTQRSVPTADLRWQWPSRARVVRRFSTHETGGRGMEFAGNRGDPVLAAAAGRVVYVGSALRGYGQLIILKHNDDYITAYGHNDQLLVREQQWVEAGEQIATMGSTGREDVRLRFELRFRGNSVNPENYLPRQR